MGWFGGGDERYGLVLNVCTQKGQFYDVIEVQSFDKKKFGKPAEKRVKKLIKIQEKRLEKLAKGDNKGADKEYKKFSEELGKPLDKSEKSPKYPRILASDEVWEFPSGRFKVGDFEKRSEFKERGKLVQRTRDFDSTRTGDYRQGRGGQTVYPRPGASSGTVRK